MSGESNDFAFAMAPDSAGLREFPRTYAERRLSKEGRLLASLLGSLNADGSYSAEELVSNERLSAEERVTEALYSPSDAVISARWKVLSTLIAPELEKVLGYCPEGWGLDYLAALWVQLCLRRAEISGEIISNKLTQEDLEFLKRFIFEPEFSLTEFNKAKMEAIGLALNYSDGILTNIRYLCINLHPIFQAACPLAYEFLNDVLKPKILFSRTKPASISFPRNLVQALHSRIEINFSETRKLSPLICDSSSMNFFLPPLVELPSFLKIELRQKGSLSQWRLAFRAEGEALDLPNLEETFPIGIEHPSPTVAVFSSTVQDLCESPGARRLRRSQEAKAAFSFYQQIKAAIELPRPSMPMPMSGVVSPIAALHCGCATESDFFGKK